MLQHEPTHSAAPPPERPASQGNSCVAGIDIGGTNLRIALADMNGQVLVQRSASTAGVRGAAAVASLIREGVLALLEQSGRPLSCLRAVAAGAPGITDVDAGVVIATSYLMGWRDVPLRALLESTLGVPAAIDNDVNLGAIGESWLGAGREARDFVFLALGTGVGAGIILNGEIFRGTYWTAGEVGYMLVPGISTEPADPGQPGALESMIGGEGIRAQWQKLWDASSLSLPRDLRATEIFDHAVQGSAPAQAILHQTAQLLAYAIYNMGLLFNCPLVVLGGRVGLHPALLEATRDSLARLRGGSQPHLALSSLTTDAQLMGAIRVALDLASTAAFSLTGDDAHRESQRSR